MKIEDVIRNTKAVYMEIDPAWNINYANNCSEKLLGVKVEMLLGTDLREVLPDVISKFYKPICQALTNRKEQNFSSFYGPTRKYLDLRATPTEIGVLAVFRDITNKKNSERQTLETEILQNAVFKTLNDALIIINDRGGINCFNPAAESIFGYKAEEMIGQNVSILLPENKRYKHEGFTLHSDLYAPRIINQGQVLKGIRRDGTLFPIEHHVSPIQVAGKRCFMCILRDITERKKAEAEIIVAKETAEKANNSKSEFISAMSHELRTPLNAVLGFAQLLELDNNLDLAQKDQVAEIIKASHHLLNLTNDILSFAKIEAGKIEIKPERISLCELLNECVALIAPLSEQYGIQVTFTRDDCVKTIWADPVRLKQVLLNLLSNAVKYNHAEGKVNLYCCGLGDNLMRITVTDNGPGIKSSHLNEMFEPFNRLGQQDSDIEGNGIGLVICKKLMEQMGGSLGVTSVFGEGSSFWIEMSTTANETDIDR